jgi:hypothetical protein
MEYAIALDSPSVIHRFYVTGNYRGRRVCHFVGTDASLNIVWLPTFMRGELQDLHMDDLIDVMDQCVVEQIDPDDIPF